MDAILAGKIAASVDTGLQRVKAMEQQCNGVPFHTAQRLEVLPSEVGTISSRQEMGLLQKEKNREQKAFGQGAGGKGKTGQGKDGKGGKMPKGKGNVQGPPKGRFQAGERM